MLPSIQKETIKLTPSDVIQHLDPDSEQHKPNLVALSIWGDNIENDKLAQLMSLLKVNSTLQELTLLGNNITPACANILADALSINCTLTYLNISANHLGDDGVKALAAAINENSTLTSLKVSMCDFSDQGAEALAKMLNTNKTLTTLKCKANQITNAGATQFCLSLVDNHTLTILDLDDDIDESLINTIAYYLARNKNILSMKFAANLLLCAKLMPAELAISALSLAYPALDVFQHSQTLEASINRVRNNYMLQQGSSNTHATNTNSEPEEILEQALILHSIFAEQQQTGRNATTDQRALEAEHQTSHTP